MYPPVIEAILAGGDIDPTDFDYGNGSPSGSATNGQLYVDLDTKDVWEYSSNCEFSTAFSTAFDALQPVWSIVWNFGEYASVATDSVVPGMAVEQNLQFIRGDAIENLQFMFRGVCWTPTRPTESFTGTVHDSIQITLDREVDASYVGRAVVGEGIPNDTVIVSAGPWSNVVTISEDTEDWEGSVLIPLPDPDPDDPLNTTTLAVPWEPRGWFSEIRNTYVSTVRYHNGWVPWYGTWPNWTWWEQYSLAGAFVCTAEWDRENAATLVTLTLSSAISNRILPSKGYFWDLESARPLDNGVYDKVHTWVRGRCEVVNQWTMTRVS